MLEQLFSEVLPIPLPSDALCSSGAHAIHRSSDFPMFTLSRLTS